jgi:hypothetical protein
MDIFGFFDYTPKSFLEKSPKEILNMKSNKVKEKFDEKYKDNEEYKQLSEDTIDAIFLLRVLKKGLKQEDKDRVLTICGIEDEPKVENSPLDIKPPSMQPRHSSIKKRTSIKQEQEQEEPAQEQMQMQEEPMQEQVEPAQFGGKRKKTRRRRNKRKACKKTKRHHRHSRKH